MHRRIRIFAEKEALIQLSSNSEFRSGFTLRHILKNLSDVWLIMSQEELDTEWANSESPLRKFCESYDLPCPKASNELKLVYKNPLYCTLIDPFALWLFNRGQEEIKRFQEYLGVWAVSPMDLNDTYFALEHSRGYDRNDVIDGPKQNGWGNFLAELPKPVPPMNSIILNDRHLLLNTNESTAAEKGFWGFNNLLVLLKELLPENLKIPFHLMIFCQHPRLNIEVTDEIVDKFIEDVQKLRPYEISIEFVFDKSRHKRGLYSNYFVFDVDRAFNAFYDTSPTKLNGENDFSIKTYLSNPFTSGDTEYDSGRSKIEKIHSQCKEVIIEPRLEEESLENLARGRLKDEEKLENRLFS